MSRRRLAAGMTIALAAGVLLLMPGTSQSAGKNKVVKAKLNNTFDPTSVTIKKGKKITWKAPAIGEDHSISAYDGEGDWVIRQALYAGNEFTRKFPKAGVYKYYCEYFGEVVDGECEGMCGVIKVKKPD